MARLNVYVPEKLAARARANGLNISALTRSAIEAALARQALNAWLDELPAPTTTASHEKAMDALDAARSEFEGSHG